MKNSKFKIFATLIMLMIITTYGYGQNPPSFDPNLYDTSAAPISALVALGIIAGGVLGYKKLK